MGDGGIALIRSRAGDPGAQLGACVTVRHHDITQQIERLAELLNGLLGVAVEQGDLAQRMGERRERLGQGAAGRFRSGDLTRRQCEILQLVAQGQTNAEIARALVLSPRTVEMHIGNILTTLDSRSRAEAVRRATELGLL